MTFVRGTLVVLAGCGSNMQVLTPFQSEKTSPSSLPSITIPSGQHPYASFQEWLLPRSLAPKVQHFQLLPMKGFLNNNHSDLLHACAIAWLEKPAPEREGFKWCPLSEVHTLPYPEGSYLCEALALFWPVMPTYHEGFKDIKPYGYSIANNQSAIFFGGSFSPWHRAHRVCIELCPFPELVIVVPDANPQKELKRRTCPWATYQEVLREVSPLGAAVFPGYSGLEHKNPTVRWLPFTRFPNKQVLMGDDSLASFPSWIEAPTLAQSISQIWVVPRRSPKTRIDSALDWFRTHARACKITFLEDHPYRDVSSTQIRNRKS